jgi:hypothetical protein
MSDISQQKLNLIQVTTRQKTFLTDTNKVFIKQENSREVRRRYERMLRKQLRQAKKQGF